MTQISASRIQEAVASIVADIDLTIVCREVTQAMDERALWGELACCLLSSQVPYDFARLAAQRIREAGVLDESATGEHEDLTGDLTALLSTPLSFCGRDQRYRFPNVRARQLSAAFGNVRREFGGLSEVLSAHRDSRSARFWLVENLPGIGPKQASMFLRNAAGAYDLAVLDRHVLRYMQTIRLDFGDGNVSSLVGYERIERELRTHAELLGYRVGLLDWAIWIVMRTASTIAAQ